VAAFATALLATALPVSPAVADADPADLAWIRAEGIDIDFTPWQWIWTRSATATTTADLPGRAGNRHSATVTIQTWSLRPGGAWVTFLDEQCDTPTGPCTRVWEGSANLSFVTSDQASVGAQGVMTAALTVPASTVTTIAPEGAPVPVGDTRIDATFTPAGWYDAGENPDRETAGSITRQASRYGDFVETQGSAQGTEMTVTGVLAGVPADTVTATQWYDLAATSGSAGDPIPPLTTNAAMAPYAPLLRRGRLVEPTQVTLRWTGRVTGPLRTSTGATLPGTVYRVDVSLDTPTVPAGSPLTGRQEASGIGLVPYDCPTPDAAFETCTRREDLPPHVYGGEARWVADRFGAVALQADLRAHDEEGTPNRGTVRLQFAAVPTGPGYGMRHGQINQGPVGVGNWSIRHVLERTLTGHLRVAGRTGVADPVEPSFVTLTRDRTGDL
jgi:hypothetical protein